MERVTYEKKDGTWGIQGIDWKNVPNELFPALSKLRDYENTGVSPDEARGYRNLYETVRDKNEKLEETLYSRSAEVTALKCALDEMRKSDGD